MRLLQTLVLMISLDTNILVRIFVDDPDNFEQSAKVGKKVSQYKTVYVIPIPINNLANNRHSRNL